MIIVQTKLTKRADAEKLIEQENFIIIRNNESKCY